jgi:quinoprotein glucose dehydrogenase
MINVLLRATAFSLLCATFISCKNNKAAEPDYTGWEMFNGNYTANKYSTLAQIDTSNVQQLQIAWTYHTSDMDTAAHSQIQCNPIIVNGIMYCTSPALKLCAVNAATGKEVWAFKPFEQVEGDAAAKAGHFNMNNNRGVAYWSDGKGDERIFYAAGPYMHAVNVKTGKLIPGFGTRGKIDLHDSLGDAFKNLFVTATTPPVIYKDLLITGTRVSEAMDAAPGHIRAYDVRTGKMRWIFHTIPHPGERGYESWEDKNAWKLSGGANNWMGMTVDQNTGIVYIPLGSVAMDFYGGKRLGNDLFGDCMLALDVATGQYKWHYQYVHHDTWDRDPSSAPVLLTVHHDGKDINAVAQTTKSGFVFLFNRATGQLLFPVKEIPVDTASELVNEKLAPTQPIPQKPAPFVRQTLTEKDLNPYLSKEEYEDVKKRLATYHTGNMFMPQSKEGTIIFPGFDGGAEWGGPAVDPETNILYVNANETAWILQMLDVSQKVVAKENYLQAGERLYKLNCMACHGPERKGGGNYPSIINVKAKYNPAEFISFINAGRRMMPSFQYLGEADKEAIRSFVLDYKPDQQKPYVPKTSPEDSFRALPYTISGYNKFLSKSGLPAIAPPWGTITAIDLNTGEHVWKTVLGNDERFAGKTNQPTGTENYGGAVVTKGGVLFIGASRDGIFRAYNKRTGQLLWQIKLPNANFATPATYELNGKQYIVLACGGGKLGTTSGDSYVAFALPDNKVAAAR